MQKIKPYDFQTRAIKGVLEVLRAKKGNVILVSPGGSGKTVMMALLVRRLLKSSKRVLIVTHRRELVWQAVAHLGRVGLANNKTAVVVPLSETASLDRQVRAGTIQTLISREDFKSADCVVVDECHHVGSKSYDELIAAYPKARIVGLTATPFRLDRKGLGDYFNHMVVAAKPSDLIKRGLIMKPVVYASTDDLEEKLSGVRVLRGEYSPRSLGEILNRKPLIGNIVDHWMKRACGKKTICFATGVEHAIAITKAFVRRGVKSAYIGGEVPRAQREDRIERLRTGEITILVNCMILSEGYDLPGCECVIGARPTLSLSLYLQQCARVLRSAPEKSRPVILDHGSNWLRFGLPEADRDYALQMGEEEGSGHPPVKVCPVCSCVCMLGCHTCPECGHAFVDPAPPEETADELVAITDAEKKDLEKRIRKLLASKGMDEAIAEKVVEAYVAKKSEVLCLRP